MTLEVNTHAGDVRLVGERLCLDFCNTVDSHHRAQPKEYLKTYADLLDWSRHSGALTAPEARALTGIAADQAEIAAGGLTRARSLRALLFRIFAAAAAGQPVLPADLAALNALLTETPARAAITATGRGFGWLWAGPDEAPERMLWPVIWSAAELLTSPDLSRVRECAGEGCSWLFLDTSRNGTRRWCSMLDCGNRAKVRRHYNRSRADS